MSRVVIAALIGVGFFLWVHRTASAAVELCPASVQLKAVGSDPRLLGTGDGLYRDEGDDSQGPARDFGFEFYASGPRTLKDTTLAVDTSGGWFTVHFPAVLLHVQKRAFEGHDPFQRDDYVSQKAYMHFPNAVKVTHAWVYSTASDGDSFDGKRKGVVTCPPPPSASPEQSYAYHLHEHKPFLIPAAGDDHLEAAPTTEDVVVVPDPSGPLEDDRCADPFDEPEARFASASYETPTLNYTGGINGAHFEAALNTTDDTPLSNYTGGISTVRIEVALDKTGNVLDAWTWQSSGFAHVDNLAVLDVRRTVFAAARSYCRNVPSIVLLNMDFGGYEETY